MCVNVSIREAELPDFDSINDLFRSSQGHDDGQDHDDPYPDMFAPPAEPPRPYEWLTECIENPSEKLYVAELENKIIGLLRGTIYTQDHPWMVAKRIGVIESVLVAESFRSQGIGASLIDRIENWFVSQAIGETQLAVMAQNHAAERLYERLGYQRFRSHMRKYPLDTE